DAELAGRDQAPGDRAPGLDLRGDARVAARRAPARADDADGELHAPAGAQVDRHRVPRGLADDALAAQDAERPAAGPAPAQDDPRRPRLDDLEARRPGARGRGARGVRA